MHMLSVQTAVRCMITTFYGSMQLCDTITRVDRHAHASCLLGMQCVHILDTLQITSCSSCFMCLHIVHTIGLLSRLLESSSDSMERWEEIYLF